MTHEEVSHRNAKWLDEIKQIAKLHSATFSFQDEVFKLTLGEKNLVKFENISLHSVLIFMRGFHCSWMFKHGFDCYELSGIDDNETPYSDDRIESLISKVDALNKCVRDITGMQLIS